MAKKRKKPSSNDTSPSAPPKRRSRENEDVKKVDVAEKQAQEKMAELRRALAVTDDYVDSFPRELAESLDVSKDVVGRMMKLEEMQALRKRAKILSQMEKCKARVIAALERGNVTTDDIPWDKDGIYEGSAISLEEFYDIDEEAKARREFMQLEVLNKVAEYMQSCQMKDTDLTYIVSWMSKFSVDVSWDEFGISPLETRVAEEEDAYEEIVSAVEGVNQCMTKLQQLIQLMMSDDTFDVLSSKLPPRIAAARNHKSLTYRKLLICPKLRTRLDMYSKLRIDMLAHKRKSISSDSPLYPYVTVLAPGAKPANNEYKELEYNLLNDFTESWKEAGLDISYYMQEVLHHRFSKPSCKKRIGRAMLVLEFLNAAVEGMLLEASQSRGLLRDAERSVSKMNKEADKLQLELSESQRFLKVAKRQVTKLKIQIEILNKSNDQMNYKINELEQEIFTLQEQVEHLQEAPSRSQFEEYKERLTKVQGNYNDIENEVEALKLALDAKTSECEVLKIKLDEEKEVTSNLDQELQTTEKSLRRATLRVQEVEKRLSNQEENIESLQNTILQKDEVIRRLTQANIEFQWKEKRESFSSRTTTNLDATEADQKHIDGTPGSGAKVRQHRTSITETASDRQTPFTSVDSLTMKKNLENALHDVKMETPPESKKKTKKKSLPGPPDISPKAQNGTKRRISTLGTMKNKRQPSQDIEKPQELLDLVQIQENTRPDDIGLEGFEIPKQFAEKLKKFVSDEQKKTDMSEIENEEQLQKLFFAVADESMKVEKEMRNFKRKISEELAVILGAYGESYISPGSPDSTNTRASSTGLLTKTTLNLDAIGEKTSSTHRSLEQNAGAPTRMGSSLLLNSTASGEERNSTKLRSSERSRSRLVNANNSSSNLPGTSNEAVTNTKIGTFAYDQNDTNRKSAMKLSLPQQQKLKSATSLLSNRRISQSDKVTKNSRKRDETEKDADSTPQPRQGASQKSKQSNNARTQHDPTKTSDTSTRTTEGVQAKYGYDVDESSSVNTSYSSSCERRTDRDDVGSLPLQVDSRDTFIPDLSTGIASHDKSDSNTASDGGDSLSHLSDDTKVAKPEKDLLDSQANAVRQDRGVKIAVQQPSTHDFDSSLQEQETIASEHNSGNENATGYLSVDYNATAHNSQTKNGEDSTNMPPRRSIADNRRMTVRNVSLNSKDVISDARRRSALTYPIPNIIKFQDSPQSNVSVPQAPSVPPKKDLGPRRDSVIQRKAEMNERRASRKRLQSNAMAARTAVEHDPFQKAEHFVKNVSDNVTDFLTQISVNLVNAVKDEKLKMKSVMEQMEKEMSLVKLKAVADVTAAQEERDKKENELNETRKALVDVLAKNPKERMTISREMAASLLPTEVASGLKQAEKEIYAMQEKLVAATEKHTLSAQDYQKRAAFLVAQIDEHELAKCRAEEEAKRRRTENVWLRIQLHELRKGEMQKLFLSLHDHQTNIGTIERNAKLSSDVKKLALTSLRSSMAHPKQLLKNLIERYKQHSMLLACTKEIKSQLKAEESSEKRIAGRLESKSAVAERWTLRSLLVRLEAKIEKLDKKWKEKRRYIVERQQNNLVKITFLLHLLKQEHRDLNIVQPTILQISGTGYHTRKDNVDFSGSMKFKDLRYVFPMCNWDSADLKAAPNTPVINKTGERVRNDTSKKDSLKTVGTAPLNRSPVLGQMGAGLWFPEGSVFCPFTNLVDKIELPKITELDVQAGLRRAKSSVLNRISRRRGTSVGITQSDIGSVLLQDREQNGIRWNISDVQIEKVKETNETTISDHYLPPIAPDFKRKSSIPSAERNNDLSNKKFLMNSLFSKLEAKLPPLTAKMARKYEHGDPWDCMACTPLSSPSLGQRRSSNDTVMSTNGSSTSPSRLPRLPQITFD